MSAFYPFIRSLNTFSVDDMSRLCEFYGMATHATKTNQIRDALHNVATVIMRQEPDPILFSRIKNLHELPYSILDARRGIHVARSVFANEVLKLRQRKTANKSAMVQTYIDDGLVVINDFLGTDNSELIREMEQLPISVNKNGSNVISTMTDNPALRSFLFDSKLRDCVFDCLMMSKTHKDASRQFLDNTFVQRVHNKPNDGDVQKIMHFDTYYDAMKFWYFPKEVKLENGPFTISPQSHIMNEARLTWMQSAYMRYYDKTIEPERTYGHAEGSLRVLPIEMEAMGLGVAPMIVPKDTFIISNVFGFHGRGEAAVDSIRDAIHGSIRLNSPFDNEE